MIKFLAHFFIPQISNNYRSKILHPKILSIFIIFFFLSGFLIYFVKNNYPQVLGISSDISIEQLLILTNQKRQENGLSPLKLDSQLMQAAMGKGSDMFSKNYWAHISPDGTTPWVFIKNAGYGYVYAGENLARGYSNSEDVVNAWMNSPSHRDNVLSSKYEDVGFAVVSGNLTGEETVLVIEMFGATRLAGEPSIASEETSSEIAVITPTPVSLVGGISPIPTAAPSLIPTPTPVNNQVARQVLTRNSNFQIEPIVNGAVFSKDLTRSITSVFIFVLILDMVIIERKKILRFVGHNLDHVLFMGLILGAIFIIMKGSVI
ncbi:MAG: hypothetical protein COU25_00870 [Candidatus Levybacteria bacterium CG10_big_fil_rev_8_21_14_0_10_35_13]|nr:MAG: hypothetical protein COU25_00870 [Candidatus Levybacteria bacterium CG10_big_fil_rev_8_21_14_0_10_35_13]